MEEFFPPSGRPIVLAENQDAVAPQEFTTGTGSYNGSGGKSVSPKRRYRSQIPHFSRRMRLISLACNLLFIFGR